MTIPVDNRFFQKGLNGYTLHGRHSCDPTVNYEGKLISPIRGGNICILDDPSYDPVTGRPMGGGFIDPVDTSQYTIDDVNAGRVTRGFNGSILECRDVNVSANSALWFIWAFHPEESHTSNVFNSFAIFAAYDKADLHADGSFANVTPASIQILGESKKLNDSFRAETSWRVMSWEPAHNFSGTLCWVVSSGKFGHSGQEPMPATLLIDTIDINRR